MQDLLSEGYDMFTIYNFRTSEVLQTLTARTEEIAYRRAELICKCHPFMVFDDTCDHGTAYDLCEKHEAVSA